MSVDNKTEYFETYLAGWNDHDPDAVVEQFAPGGTYTDPNTERPLGGTDIGAYVAGTVQGFPDLRFEEHRLLVNDSEEGELVLVAEWTMHGTHTGEFDGLPPTGNTVALDGVDIVTLTDEGITSITGYYDLQTFADQLGLTFPKVVGQLPKLAVGAIRRTL